MGRATKWFRAIFGLSNQQHPNHKAKKWIFGKKSKQSTDFHHKESTRNDVVEKYDLHEVDEEEENRHAIAVSAAAVVKITSVGATVRRSGAGYGESANVSREDWAAVVVQSHFRGYLARRALRALRGLVKLQALARGHLVRKQTAYALRRLQALIRAQDEIRSVRVNMMSESPHSRRKSSPFTYTGPTTPENSECAVRARNAIKNERSSSLKLNSDFSHSQQKPHSSRPRTHNNRNGERTSQRRSLTADSEPIHKHALSRRAHSSHLSLSTDQCCQSFSTSKDSITHQSILSPSSAEAQSLSRSCNVEEAAFRTAADNSPRFCSSSSIGGNSSICRRERHNTPTKSDGTRSCFSNYSDHPSYMAYTESSKAKVRSLSVPKQRLMQHETSSSASRYSRSNTKRSTNLHANDAYMGSGRLDVLGMPVRSDRTRFSGSLWQRY